MKKLAMLVVAVGLLSLSGCFADFWDCSIYECPGDEENFGPPSPPRTSTATP